MKLFSLNWTPSPKFLAGSCHIGWACSYGIIFKPNLYPYYITVIIFVAYTLFKEYVADLTFLEQDTFLGSTFDALTYTIGYLIGLIALYINIYLGLGATVGVMILLTYLDYHNFLPEVISHS